MDEVGSTRDKKMALRVKKKMASSYKRRKVSICRAEKGLYLWRRGDLLLI